MYVCVYTNVIMCMYVIVCMYMYVCAIHNIYILNNMYMCYILISRCMYIVYK